MDVEYDASAVLDVRWRTSWHDLGRGLLGDLGPTLAVSGIGTAWLLAADTGGVPAFAWLGGVLLLSQVVRVAQVAAMRCPAPLRAERGLVVRGATFEITDGDQRDVLTAPVAGVLDADGVLRVSFTDGRTVEVPWRAFSNAELRRVRRHLRARTGAPGEPAHVPVRRVGDVLGPGTWRHPVLAAIVAVGLGLLPWLLQSAGS